MCGQRERVYLYIFKGKDYCQKIDIYIKDNIGCLGKGILCF